LHGLQLTNWQFSSFHFSSLRLLCTRLTRRCVVSSLTSNDSGTTSLTCKLQAAAEAQVPYVSEGAIVPTNCSLPHHIIILKTPQHNSKLIETIRWSSFFRIRWSGEADSGPRSFGWI